MAYAGTNATFTDALMNLRRKAQLQGRPLTQAETSGITEGMAESASERLAKAKAAALGEKQVALQHDQLGLMRQDMERQSDIANKMMRQEKYKNYATTGLLGLGGLNELLMPKGGTGLQGLAQIPQAVPQVASGLWGAIKSLF